MCLVGLKVLVDTPRPTRLPAQLPLPALMIVTSALATYLLSKVPFQSTDQLGFLCLWPTVCVCFAIIHLLIFVGISTERVLGGMLAHHECIAGYSQASLHWCFRIVPEKDNLKNMPFTIQRGLDHLHKNMSRNPSKPASPAFQESSDREGHWRFDLIRPILPISR